MISRLFLATFLLAVTSASHAGQESANSPPPTGAKTESVQEPVSVEAASLDPKAAKPIAVAFDIAPGYRNEVYFEFPENGEFDFSVKHLQSSPSGKWKPTAYIALLSEQCDVGYFLNFSVDTALNKSYVRVRLIDIKKQSELENITHQKLYELDHEFRVSGTLREGALKVFVDGELVDQRELSCRPAKIELGASSGKFVTSVLEGSLATGARMIHWAPCSFMPSI